METIYTPMDLKTLSHELRTPLTGILGNVYLLRDESLTPQQQNYLNDLVQSGDRLMKVINYLLTESKQAA